MYYDWKREGGTASNTQNVGAKNSSLDLYGEINKQTKVYYDWKRGGGGLQTPKSWGKNSSFKFHGVNSRLFLYKKFLNWGWKSY